MRHLYRIDEHETAEIQKFNGNYYISFFVNGSYSSGASKFCSLEDAETNLYRLRPTATKTA